MSDIAWERETLSLLHDAEKEKRNAELALEKVRQTIQSKEQDILALRLALEHYRRKYGLPSDPIPSTVADEEYGHLGPSAAVEQWADRHNDEVVLKELAGELLRTNVYKDYRVAYNSIYTVLKRSAHFKKTEPGHYKRSSSSTILLLNSHVPSAELFPPTSAVTATV